MTISRKKHSIATKVKVLLEVLKRTDHSRDYSQIEHPCNANQS